MTRNFLNFVLGGATSLSLFGMASASTIIFSDDFEGGVAPGWADGAYSDDSTSAGGVRSPNADTPGRSASVVAPFDGSSFGFELATVMFDKDANPSWAGTQVSSPFIAGSGFTGADPADVEMGFKFAVTADPGVIGTVRFELRESGGITTHAVSVPVSDIAGGINTFSFNMDDNQSGAFSTRGTGFDTTKDHQIFVQIQQDWALNGSTRNIDLVMDDFSIINTVPEPSGALLGLIGAGLFAARRRR